MKYLIALLIAFAIVFTSFPANSKSTQTDSKGKKAINFKLEDVDGNLVELKKEIGEGPILLAFWATWCKPCVEEMAEYNKLYKEFKSKGFKLLAISIDNEKSLSKVKPYVKSKNYDFSILLDTNSEVARKYYAQAVPYTVIIDKDGKIIYTHLGYMKGDELQVKKIIEEQLNSK